jgi:predicted N-acetyltransferase YhbS
MTMTLRTMTESDVEAGLRLCRLSHWNQLARDWQQFLRLTPGGATVAVDESGTVVGSVATMRYAPHLAWIAMVLVDPAARGRGVGTALLHRGLEQVKDVRTVGLDATPLGQPLYEKLGFVVHSTLTRLERAADEATPTLPRDDGQTTRIRPATRDDLELIVQLDEQATGLVRHAMLAWLLEGAPGFAWVRDAWTVDAFLLGRHGHTFAHLGPVVARSTETALALVRTCLARHPGRRFIVDVSDHDPEWRAGLEAIGFRAQRPFARMYTGTWRPEGDPELLRASIGPEFG